MSVEEIAAGMNAANANALRLVEDAKAWLAAGRAPARLRRGDAVATRPARRP